MTSKPGLVGAIGRYLVLMSVVFSATYLAGVALTNPSADVNVVMPAAFGLLGTVAGGVGNSIAQSLANGYRDRKNGNAKDQA